MWALQPVEREWAKAWKAQADVRDLEPVRRVSNLTMLEGFLVAASRV